MTKKSTIMSMSKRVNVKDLPATETKLTGTQMKKVKGGFQSGALHEGDQIVNPSSGRVIQTDKPRNSDTASK